MKITAKELEQSLLTKINKAEELEAKVGQPSGIAGLDANGKVPSAQLDVDTSSLATKAELTTHEGITASLTAKGHVQLDSSTTSEDETKAATPKAVKLAMDQANAAFQFANDGKTAIATAITAKGVAASPSDSFSLLAEKIGQIASAVVETFSGTGTTDSGMGLTVSFNPFEYNLSEIIIYTDNTQTTQHIVWKAANGGDMYHRNGEVKYFTNEGGYVRTTGFKFYTTYSSKTLAWKATGTKK